eukprot:COSAG04_NODE_5042_length_1767_cov_2.122302_1_plen_201_part_00
MFDNDFTLTKLTAPSSWQGSVEVAGFIHYHNTITIPNDENWIVQGVVDPASGLPSSLDGRLKSGTAVDRSHANIVLRHLRISGQVAPVDVNTIGRNAAMAGQTAGFGGAFEYDGGSSDPSNLVKIAFIEVVFDHNAVSRRRGGHRRACRLRRSRSGGSELGERHRPDHPAVHLLQLLQRLLRRRLVRVRRHAFCRDCRRE